MLKYIIVVNKKQILNIFLANILQVLVNLQYIK